MYLRGMKNKMETIIKDAVQVLKHNYYFRANKNHSISFIKFANGIYNRLDELGLIYSSFKDISFNQAVDELDMKDILDEIKILMEKER